MALGAPFPQLYDWTIGELMDLIRGHEAIRKQELQTQASMLFRHASLVSRMVTGKKGDQFLMVDEFDFLWSDEEREEIKTQMWVNDLEASLRRHSHEGEKDNGG